MRRLAPAAALAGLLVAACSSTPAYHPPVVTIPASFKELPGWQPAEPSDAVARGAWWQLFNDPELDRLEARVLVSNQTLAADAAAYRQATAAVREARAQLFPEVDLTGRATKAGSFGHGRTIIIDQGTGTSGTGNSGGTGTGSGGIGTGTGTNGTGTGVTTGTGSTRFSLTASATWEPDLWGRIGASVSQARATAAASRGDLASAALSIQGELATDYLQLRGLDAQAKVLADTLTAYGRALQITINRYNAGVSAKTDVLQAQTQLGNAQASYDDLARQRALYEHAIAVLVGANPSSFGIAPAGWSADAPAIPGILPSVLLQRRPDVAAAERRVAAANSAVGIERSAFFPSLDLSGDVGSSASSLKRLFDLSSTIWSLGLSGVETLLDFGARSARVAEARAAFDQAAVNYRQTALTAFQQVEDGLVGMRVLGQVSAERAQAASEASQVEQLVLNQYLAGQISFTDVITAQTTALSARQTAIQAAVDRQVAAVSLVQAIGGSWTGEPPALPLQSSTATSSE